MLGNDNCELAADGQRQTENGNHNYCNHSYCNYNYCNYYYTNYYSNHYSAATARPITIR